MQKWRLRLGLCPDLCMDPTSLPRLMAPPPTHLSEVPGHHMTLRVQDLNLQKQRLKWGPALPLAVAQPWGRCRPAGGLLGRTRVGVAGSVRLRAGLAPVILLRLPRPRGAELPSRCAGFPKPRMLIGAGRPPVAPSSWEPAPRDGLGRAGTRATGLSALGVGTGRGARWTPERARSLVHTFRLETLRGGTAEVRASAGSSEAGGRSTEDGKLAGPLRAHVPVSPDARPR